MRRTAVGAFAVVGLLAACGAESPLPTSPATSSGSSAASTVSLPECPPPDDVSAIIDVDDLELYPGPPGDELLCSYSYDGGSLLVTAQLGGSDAFEQKRRRVPKLVDMFDGAATSRPVPDVGDDALLIAVDAPEGAETLELFVRYGELVVSVGTPAGDPRLSVAVALAALVRG